MGEAHWEGKWDGGRTYRNANGDLAYFIEKMVKGKRYRVPALGLEGMAGAALKQELEFQLKTFLRDPAAYGGGQKAKVEPEKKTGVFLNEAMIMRCIKNLKEADCSSGYLQSVTSYLFEWQGLLNDRDLTTVDAAELVDLVEKSGRSKRLMISALKTFTSYCREVIFTLKLRDDPTAEIKTLKGGKSKHTQRMDLSVEEAEKLYRCLSEFESVSIYGRKPPLRFDHSTAQVVRDQILIHLKTGIHESELLRIVRGERGAKIQELKSQGLIAGTVLFRHKNGLDHIQSLDHQTMQALLRLKKLGQLAGDSYTRRMLKLASEKAGLKGALTIRKCRHTFVTLALQMGVEVQPVAGKGMTLEQIAKVTGHKSTDMTEVYLGEHVPALAKMPYELKHPDDPKLESPHLGEQVTLATSRAGLHKATGRRAFRNPPRGNK